LDAVRENRQRFLRAIGAAALPVLAPRQVHSAHVAVDRADMPLPNTAVLEGDAVVSDRRGVALLVLAADCLPVLLYDPSRCVIGVVHAGWRGTAGAIVQRAVEAMRESFGCVPAHIRAALGPAIGRCCYEVGPEVLEQVSAVTPLAPAALVTPLPNRKGLLDLGAANEAQLIGAGLRPGHIERLNLCTACHPDRFFSHRREGEPTGRTGAAIAFRPT
jgi:YfiH family protein